MSRPKKNQTVYSAAHTTSNTTKLQPTPGYLVIKPQEAEKKTVSGIYLPDSKEDQPQYGTVLSVGDPIFDHGHELNSPVQVGDKVVYKKWGGNEVKISDVDYQILKFEDVLAIIK